MYLASLSAQNRLLLEAIEYTSKKLKDSKVCNEPFEHYIIEDFLHPEIFQKIDIFVKDQKNELRPKNNQDERKIININDMDPNHQEFKTDVSVVPRFFNSLELKVQFTDFMKKHIKHESWEERDTDIGALYFEDSLGYQLPPHTDVPQKLITCLIYCADDDESPDMGTSLFKLKKGFRADREKYHWYDFSQFDEIKRIPYKPNTALLFSPSNTSFHGVVESNSPKIRKVLQYQVTTGEYRHQKISLNENANLLKNELRERAVNYRKSKLSHSFKYDDKKIKFSLSTEICVERAFTLLTKEPETIKWINSFGRDEIFFDIGANIGVYSLWAAIYRSCRVFSFEPEAYNYAILNENIQANNAHGSVLAFCMAISDTTGIGQMSSFDPLAGKSGHQLYSGRKRLNPIEPKHTVQGIHSCRLDDVVNNLMLPCPNHIKIDVDGIEPRILAGGLDVIKRAEVKSMMIEVDMKNFEHLQMLDLLQKSGFRSLASLVTEASNKHKGNSYNSNFLFVKEEYLKKISE